MTSMKIARFSGPPTLLVYLHPKVFHPLDLGRPISNELPTPFPNDNQSVKKSIIQGWLLHGIRSFLQVGFRFHHQNSLIFFGFPLTSFHLVEASLSAFKICSKINENLLCYHRVHLYNTTINIPIFLNNYYYILLNYSSGLQLQDTWNYLLVLHLIHLYSQCMCTDFKYFVFIVFICFYCCCVRSFFNKNYASFYEYVYIDVVT